MVMLVNRRELREAAEKLRERFHGTITMEHLHLHICVSAAPCTERLKYSAMATVHLILIFSPSFSSSVFQRRSQYQSHDYGDGSNLVNLQPKGWRRTDLENNGPFPVSQIRIFTPAWTVGCLGNRKELCSVRFSLWSIDIPTTHN